MCGSNAAQFARRCNTKGCRCVAKVDAARQRSAHKAALRSAYDRIQVIFRSHRLAADAPERRSSQRVRKPTMSSELIKHTSDDAFSSDVLSSDLPVLVDYWAEWCGPCKMIAPLLDEVSKTYDGKVQVVKVNVDDNPGSAQRFGIRGIPTLKLFKDGAEVASQVGAVSKSQLTAFLDSHL
jgi:thioredoxin 1